MRLGPLAAPASARCVMAPLSDVEEVEVLLRQCTHLCLGVVEAGDNPGDEDFSTAWDELMARVEHACGKLGRATDFPAVHNWVVFQELRTILSAKHRWPQHLQAHVLAFWRALGRAVARRGSSSAPNRTEMAEATAPMGHQQLGRRRPDAHHLQQWTEAAVRRHRRLAADALAYIRPAPLDEDGIRISKKSFAERVLAEWGGTAPLAWPEEVGQQHPHPVWDCAGGSTPLDSINVTSLKAAEEHLYRRHTAIHPPGVGQACEG